MREILQAFVVIAILLLIQWTWKVFNWIWLKPKKLEKCLREQGLKGSSYKFLFGDIKEMIDYMNAARTKPMELSHQIVPRVMPFLHDNVQKYGKTHFTWIGPNPRVNIVDPDMIRGILSSKFDHFEKRALTPLEKKLITGLASYNGEKWTNHRRIINPAFHLEKLKMMLPAFHTSCLEMVDKWHKLVANESCELDVWPELQNLATDVISRTAFSSCFEEGRRIFQLHSEMAKHIIRHLYTCHMFVPGYRFLPTKINRRMKELSREMRSILRNMILNREKVMKAGQVQNNNDLLWLLLMESNIQEMFGNTKNVGITIDEIIDECNIFFHAGQDVPSSLLVWTMICLSMHQDWQQKAREEVSQVFGGQRPEFEGLNNLKIVPMILNEVLRLYPPAVLLQERVTYKEMQVGKFIFPPGVQLSMLPLLVHHDSELWGKDAEKFNPARFAEGISKATKNEVSFLPFSWGPRICIGQNFALIEAKMVISMILQHFTFELSPTYVHAPHLVITLNPKHGAQIILHQI
ncbi:hypothetical protein AQUCO_08600031v1 [Aquilegia coerulea]|uniref:Cytochrome P450 n=1 Tax=Aquilegia coerulea TaxID=218851 RepID=A0A2G5C6I1_AQUCA|nr:hypothetical protein AQUCO_08600031v1 [Aquilegia coerulea]